MKSKILWKASRSKKNNSNLFRYEKFLSSKYNFKVTQKYKKLIEWSIKNPRKFLTFSTIKHNKYRSIADYISGMTDRFAINIYKSIK